MSKSVSILIPVFNCEAFLRQCLDSVVGQTYRDLQVVVVDDGSTDGSWAIMQEYSARDSRVEVYHQENAGVATARNSLLDLAKGDFVLFVDSDDWLELNTIETLMNEQAIGDYDMVTFNSVEDCVYTQEQAVKEFLRHINFAGSLWNKLTRRTLFKDLRFDPSVSYAEDALMTWHVLQRLVRVRITPHQLYNHRMIDASISHQSWTPQKKGSGSIVWRTITEETAKWWPQYLDIAQARYAIEDMWGLYYASLAEYPYDEHIRERQLNVRRNLRLIRKSGLVSTNKIVTCYALAYCYSLGRFLKYTRK